MNTKSTVPSLTYALPMPAQRVSGHGDNGRDGWLDAGSGARRRLSGAEIETLVARVRNGDATAWDVLVRCLSPALHRGIGAFTLSVEARDDVFSNTWLKLLEHIDRIEKPASLVSWLMTTARNEALQFVKARSRYVPMAEPDVASVDHRGMDEALLDSELSVAVWRAFQHLSAACQSILRLLTLDPPLPYDEIVELLGLPHGSIGPTKGRCLEKLRSRPELRVFLDRQAEGGFGYA
jgi:RNA polymerase sigma factor (sigma-70 family)